MTHIPEHRLLPHDMVEIYDHGPPAKPAPDLLPEGHTEEQHAEHEAAVARHKAHEADRAAWLKKNPRPAKHRMHASDARHPMSVEPERWMLDAHKPVAEQEKPEGNVVSLMGMGALDV
jgi:hypothetical protein